MEELTSSLNGAATQEETGAPVTAAEVLEVAAGIPAETIAEIEVVEKPEVPVEVIAVAEKPVTEVKEEVKEPETVVETLPESEVVFHTVTDEDLVVNTELSDLVAVGDEIGISELSLVDQFKAQAEIADSADPELDISDWSIKEQILDHLEFSDKDLWTNISPLLNKIAEKESVAAIKKAVDELVAEKKIKYHANAHEMWGSPSGSDADHKTTYHSIENLNLYVKLA